MSRPLLALLFVLACGLPQALAANADSIPDCVLELSRAKRVHVHHERQVYTPVPFATMKPCGYVNTTTLADVSLGPEWARRIAALLAKIGWRPNPVTSTCGNDTTFASNVWLQFSSGGKNDINVILEFDRMVVSVARAGRWETFARFDGVADSLLVLLSRAVPRDVAIASIVTCARTDSGGSHEGWALADSLPKEIVKVPPDFTSLAREADIDGTVIVRALVGADGIVERTLIANSIPVLDGAAARAVEQWLFDPALAAGKPVAVWVAIPVRYRLLP